MNSCFEKFVDFKRIMSDEPDRVVASENNVIFQILSKALKRMQIFLISSNDMSTGVTLNLLIRQNMYG